MEPILIGILLDVSASMQNSVGRGVDEEGGAWVRSIFSVIDNLIKHDLKPNNHVFAIGVGASCGHTTFDLLGTLKYVQNIHPPFKQGRSLKETLSGILDIAEEGGASTVKQWAPMDILTSAMVFHEAKCALVLRKLESDPSFVRDFVRDCLPSVCRDFGGSGVVTDAGNYAYTKCVSVACGRYQITASGEDIEKVRDKAERKIMKCISAESIFKVHDAHTILHGYVEEKDLTKERTRELMKNVEPFIYGRTPLIGALKQSEELFSSDDYHDHKKLLFVLSDGEPTDGEAFSISNQDDITVVSCLITSSIAIDPCMLHNTATDRSQWKSDAKFMFNLSSLLATQKLPRTIFVQRGWKVDMTNNETKLFLQVNHPDHLKDVCNLARNVVTSQEALSDVLASVDLDIYINQSNSGFSAQKQIGPTCYANASAAVIHLATKRILGRKGGYPDFNALREQMISCFSKRPEGERGADTEVVLQELCPQYRLRCERTDRKGAMEAIIKKRPVVARFRLTESEWIDFGRFYLHQPRGVLTRGDLDTNIREPSVKTLGHAVVLTSFNSKCLRLMNSWGSKFADNGFFSVQDTDVLGLEFFDISWTLPDLFESETAYYKKHGSEVADKLMKDLKGLQKATFQCPICHKSSKVTEFTGRLTQATCPQCRNDFKCSHEGNILALNLYLTSLFIHDSQQISSRAEDSIHSQQLSSENLRVEDSIDSQLRSFRNLRAEDSRDSQLLSSGNLRTEDSKDSQQRSYQNLRAEESKDSQQDSSRNLRTEEIIDSQQRSFRNLRAEESKDSQQDSFSKLKSRRFKRRSTTSVSKLESKRFHRQSTTFVSIFESRRFKRRSTTFVSKLDSRRFKRQSTTIVSKLESRTLRVGQQDSSRNLRAEDSRVGQQDSSRNLTAEDSRDSQHLSSRNLRVEDSRDSQQDSSRDVRAEDSRESQQRSSRNLRAEDSYDIQQRSSRNLRAEDSVDSQQHSSRRLKAEGSIDSQPRSSRNLRAEGSIDSQQLSSRNLKAEDSKDSQQRSYQNVRTEDLRHSQQLSSRNLRAEDSIHSQQLSSRNLRAEDLIDSQPRSSRNLRAEGSKDSQQLSSRNLKAEDSKDSQQRSYQNVRTEDLRHSQQLSSRNLRVEDSIDSQLRSSRNLRAENSRDSQQISSRNLRAEDSRDSQQRSSRNLRVEYSRFGQQRNVRAEDSEVDIIFKVLLIIIIFVIADFLSSVYKCINGLIYY